MKLIVVRHQKTQDGVENKFCSGDRDIPVVEIENDPYFFGLSVEAMGHTGLIRTKQTAKTIARVIGYNKEFLVFPELRERIGGSLQGYSLEELQKLFPVIQKPADLWKIEAPEMGLEDLASFLSRIKKGLNKIKCLPHRSLLVVAHAGTIKGIHAVLYKQSLKGARKTLCGPTPESLKAVWFNMEVIE